MMIQVKLQRRERPSTGTDGDYLTVAVRGGNMFFSPSQLSVVFCSRM